jgi:ornithine--oxo-acid transaminase
MATTTRSALDKNLSHEEVLELTEQRSAHNYAPMEVVLTRGQGVHVWDKKGNKLFDMLGCYSALNVGHLHPRLVDVAVRQLQKISLTSRAFYTEEMALFAEVLCELTGMEKMLPMNTGAEAVETAIKMSRRWAYRVKGVEANKAEIIVCSGNFHGRTTTIVSFSDDPEAHDDYGPYTPGFVTIPFNDPAALEAAITPNTAAFLVEPIQGEGGIIVPDDGYLVRIREICDRHNVLLVLDEVQTGFFRTGKVFAFQHEEMRPDALIMGKALGGGIMPVSAVASSHEVMDAAFLPGSHGSTFGGNPLSSAVAVAAIELMQEERMDEQAAEKGAYFMGKLRALNSPLVKEIRGKGLLIGMEFTREAGKAKPYLKKMMKQGLLAKDTHEQTVRFAPPITITREEIDQAVEMVASVICS